MFSNIKRIKFLNKRILKNIQEDKNRFIKNNNKQRIVLQLDQTDTFQPMNGKQKITRQQAISNIISYSQKYNNLIQRYNQDFFINYFDSQTIQDLASSIPGNLQMKKQEFIRKLVTFIKHKQNETLFLVISLLNIYKKIKDQTKSQNGIKLSDFTTHICDKISSQGAQLLIPLRQIPGQRLKLNPFKIRSIDLQPPVIVSQVEKQIPQISKSKKKKDKKVDPLKPLSQFFISPSNALIMTLGSLSSTINIYNFQLEKKKQISPSCFKVLDKKLAILSFAFSQKQQRIGAIINNIGIAFWDFSDQFRSQKLIQKTNVGSKIFYLELNDEWVTANTENIMYWDLKQQNIKCEIYEQKSKSINDICQISHIRGLGVGYTLKDQSKWLIIYQANKKQKSRYSHKSCKSDQHEKYYEIQFKRLARINLNPSGCHTLYYNRFTQIIVPLGYKNTISLYNIDSQSLDINLLHQLKGHQTIVTSISQIDQTDIIFSGDDRGHVIIWTLTDLRCQQTIKIANYVSSIKSIGNFLFYGDTRINLVKLEGIDIKIENKNTKYLVKSEQFYGIFKTYRLERNQIYIFTRKTCRILSMLNGKTLKIVELCSQDQQILVVQNFMNGFIMGTSKGDIFNYTLQFQLKWKLSSVHSSDTTQLKVDEDNRFFLSNGRDNNIFIWAQKTVQEQGPRKSLINSQENYKQQIVTTELSQKFGLFITCSYNNQLRIWDYESLKLIHILMISNQSTVHPVCIKISDLKPLIIVACSNQTVLIYKFARKQHNFSFKLIAKIDKKILLPDENFREKIKKSPNCNMIHGLSIIQNNQNKNNNLFQSQKTRYSLSNTLQDIKQINEYPVQAESIDHKNCQSKLTTSFLVEQILLDFKPNNFKILIAYGKGRLIHINITNLIQQYFCSLSSQSFKKSANIQRPIKQNLIKQIYKSQVDRTPFDKKIFNHTFNVSQNLIVWKLKVHKDSITHLDIYQSQYISTLCTDGYYKLLSLFTGTMICSLNINFPLPIKWDYRPHKSQQFTQKIHEALLLINQIFCYTELSKIQFDALNVRPFLDEVCKAKTRTLKQKTFTFKNQQFRKQKKQQQNCIKQKQEQNKNNTIKNPSQSFKIQVLSDQFAPEDIKRVSNHYASLKSYQVYKRVKKFINVRESELQLLSSNKSGELNRNKSQIQQRESTIQFLSPNYMPKLLNKDLVNAATQKLVLSQKYNHKSELMLTKNDFKKIYDSNHSNSFKQNSNSGLKQSQFNSPKSVSRQKINLSKINDTIIDAKLAHPQGQKKMRYKGFQIGLCSFNYGNKISLASLNRSQVENMNMTHSSIHTNKANIMKQLCDKTYQFKKMHKIIKL